MPENIKIKDKFGLSVVYPTPEVVNLRDEETNDLIPYIKNGVNTDDATATAADIREGVTAYVAGEKITGELISSGGNIGYRELPTDWEYYTSVREDVNNSIYLIVSGLYNDTLSTRTTVASTQSIVIYGGETGLEPKFKFIGSDGWYKFIDNEWIKNIIQPNNLSYANISEADLDNTDNLKLSDIQGFQTTDPELGNIELLTVWVSDSAPAIRFIGMVPAIAYSGPFHSGLSNISTSGVGSYPLTFFNLDSIYPILEFLDIEDYWMSTAWTSSFNGSNRIKQFKVPDTVTSIGAGCFKDVHNLKELDLNNVTTLAGSSYTIGRYFENTAIEYLDMRKIADVSKHYAFSGMSNLVSIHFGSNTAGITTSGSYAFNDCKSLRTILYDNPNFTIVSSSNVFYGCNLIESLPKMGGASVASYSFYGEIILKEIDLSNFTGTQIRDEAFMNCYNLESIILPESMSTISISSRGFANCRSLKTINLPPLITASQYMFSNCTQLSSISSDNATTSNIYAYSNCQSLVSISIQNNVTIIANSMFTGCHSLATINLPTNLKTIDSSAFNGCRSLESLVIPTGTTTINDSAFRDCLSLTAISIPDTVTSINSSAFSGCRSLDHIPFPSSVTTIEHSMFVGCTSFVNITIPDTVTSMLGSVFKDCTSLESITIPLSITTISNNVFENCTALTSINIHQNITSIGSTSFKNCASLTSLEFPDIISTVGYNAFQGCVSLSSINIPTSLPSLNTYIFEGCISLVSITIPDNITSIQAYAFSGCTSLTTVVLLATTRPTLSNINAFSNNHPDRKFYVPDESLTHYKTGTNWLNYASVIFPLSELPE